MSLVVALGLFPPLLTLVGPVGDTGSVKACYRKKETKVCPAADIDEHSLENKNSSLEGTSEHALGGKVVVVAGSAADTGNRTTSPAFTMEKTASELAGGGEAIVLAGSDSKGSE